MSPSSSSVPRLRMVLASVVLFTLTALLFSRTLGNDFINYDDPDYVTDNPHVQPGLSWEGVKWAFTTGRATNWHPLTWLSHQLDCELFGLNPAGHHATSVFWHALNAVLVFLVFKRLTGAFWTSAFAAALFAWHPLRVESVAWISERKDVLSAFFGLLTLWLYTFYARSETQARRWLNYILVAVSFALGLLSKPMLVTLPFLLVLLDLWPLGRLQLTSLASWLKITCEKIPLFLLASASCAATFLAQKDARLPGAALELPERLANAAVSVARYLGTFFWPVDLAVLYPYPLRWSTMAVGGGVALIVLLTGSAWRERNRRPWLLTGWLWFLGMLVPVIGFVQVGVQSKADRYTYLPLLGWQLALLWTLRSVFTGLKWRISAMAFGLFALGLCSLLTWQQIGRWRNSICLFEHTAAVTGANPIALGQLGNALIKANRAAEAIPHLQEATRLRPDFSDAYNNLGVALAGLQRMDEALASFQSALAIDPDFASARANLANTARTVGRLDEALEQYEAALRIEPKNADILNSLGHFWLETGQLEKAKPLFEAALSYRPRFADALNNLGIVLARTGHTDDAIRLFRQAIALPSAFTATQYRNLGNALAQKGVWLEAIEAYNEALRLDPNYATARESRDYVIELLRTNTMPKGEAEGR